MNRFITTCSALALCLTLGGRAHAQHAGDMIIGSTGDGTGALAVEFEFDTVVRLSYDQDIGPYTGDEPGFDALATDEPLESFYVLDNGTTVTVEVTAIDEGRLSLVLNATTLAAPGDSVLLGTAGVDLHHHPIFRIQLLQPAGQYGDARVSFKLTTTSGSYTSSKIYSLRASNAHLAPPDYTNGAPGSVDTASLSCQAEIGKQTKKLIGKVYGLLEKCADKIAAVQATSAAGLPTATAQGVADKTCGDGGGSVAATSTMVAKINAAVASSAAKVTGKCATSGDFDANAVAQNLGLAVCHVQDMIAAAYHGTHEALVGITEGGNPVSEALPCLVPTAEAD